MANPGFPVGGAGPLGGGGLPPARALFGGNMCKNELGPVGGGVPPMKNAY